LSGKDVEKSRGPGGDKKVKLHGVSLQKTGWMLGEEPHHRPCPQKRGFCKKNKKERTPKLKGGAKVPCK